MSLPDHTPLRAPLAAIPRDLVSVADYARYAPGFIAPPVLEYIAGGGADEVTLKRNRQKLDELMILPRPLVDCTRGGTHTTVLGEHLRHPLLLAPVAFQQLVHPDGELSTATAASVLETGMVVSTLASQPLEGIAARLKAFKLIKRCAGRGEHHHRFVITAGLGVGKGHFGCDIKGFAFLPWQIITKGFGKFVGRGTDQIGFLDVGIEFLQSLNSAFLGFTTGNPVDVVIGRKRLF